MLLFSLDVAVSVALSLACNIHIGEKERDWYVSDVSTVHALVSFNFFWSNPKVFFSLKPFAPQGESFLKISTHKVQSFQRS